MEFDAEIKAIYAKTSTLTALDLPTSFPLFLSAFSSNSDLAKLSALGYNANFTSYSWNPTNRELTLEFIQSNIHDTCRALLDILHRSGFVDIEALIYSDECECIMDDDGVVHRLGERMYMNADNKLIIEDYPEVEYEYV
jgi:hypothetical protein